MPLSFSVRDVRQQNKPRQQQHRRGSAWWWVGQRHKLVSSFLFDTPTEVCVAPSLTKSQTDGWELRDWLCLGIFCSYDISKSAEMEFWRWDLLETPTQCWRGYLVVKNVYLGLIYAVKYTATVMLLMILLVLERSNWLKFLQRTYSVISSAVL